MDNIHDDASKMQNRAGDARSPFIRSFKNSQVLWQELDTDAISRAKEENKLIFLHIGYKACHHCRLMVTESFSNSECVSILNETFIPVLVDREERPDIDITYMNYVQAVSNSGGWPLNLFLTPALEPVFGGTYWPGPGTVLPSTPEGGDEVLDFLVILKKLRNTWRDQEIRCRREAADIFRQLQDFAAEGTLGTKSIAGSQSIISSSASATPAPTTSLEGSNDRSSISSELDLDQLEEAYRRIAGTFDPVCGGFGLAPKFPTPPKLEFLLNLKRSPQPVVDVVGEAECEHAATMAIYTLRQLRNSALYDHIGQTGFFRCSITPDWSIPNFEKLVVDNALLLSRYLDAWNLSGGKEDSEFYDTVIDLADYLTSPTVALPQSGFATSEAADSYVKRGASDMREGAYFLWTRREFDDAVGATDSYISQVVAAYFDIQEDGNVDQDHDPNDDFINQNVPRVVRTADELSKQFSIPVETVQKYIEIAKSELKTKRDIERVTPEIDDKIVAGWNGLVISALARTANAIKDLKPVASDKYLSLANTAAAFIKEELWIGESGDLYRIWKDGRGGHRFADDYAYLTMGLLDLFEATGNEEHLQFADEVQKAQITLFSDPAGGFYTTPSNSPQTILRLKDGMDTSLPSVNSVSVANLFRLGHLLQDEKYTSLAHETINAFESEILQHPWLFPGLLAGLVTARLGCDESSKRETKYQSTREKLR